MENENLYNRLRRRLDNRRREEEKHSQEHYQAQSRQRLSKIIHRKIRTAFIGALARVESYIGEELWGHGLPEKDCTPEQKLWREVWEQCRTDILDNGNNQLRAADAEISQYDVKWNRHHLGLRPEEEA